MADQDVLDLVLLEQLVVNVQHGSAGVAEHVFDPLLLQAAHDDFSASQFHGPSPSDTETWNVTGCRRPGQAKYPFKQQDSASAHAPARRICALSLFC
ncbi:hypothetical protein D3C83_59220 [compost metagenome]